MGGEMRKRISCKIIRSVPLAGSSDALCNVAMPTTRDFRTADGVTYTRRLVITRACPDQAAGVRTFDLYA
jgi:hypothetical protein